MGSSTAAALAAAHLLATGVGTAPTVVQAVLIRKIMAYDETVKHDAGTTGALPEMLLVHGPSHEPDSAASELRGFLERAGFVTRFLVATELPAACNRRTVLYLLDEAAVAAASQCIPRQALTVAGLPEYVETGQAALGIVRDEQGKPGIVVHLGRLRQEGHSISARLLALARVVQ